MNPLYILVKFLLIHQFMILIFYFNPLNIYLVYKWMHAFVHER